MVSCWQRGYLGARAAGWSEFQMFTMHFQEPLGCFLQTLTHLLVSVTGFPRESLTLIAQVPMDQARSPALDTATLVCLQAIVKFGSANSVE